MSSVLIPLASNHYTTHLWHNTGILQKIVQVAARVSCWESAQSLQRYCDLDLRFDKLMTRSMYKPLICLLHSLVKGLQDQIAGSLKDRGSGFENLFSIVTVLLSSGLFSVYYVSGFARQSMKVTKR